MIDTAISRSSHPNMAASVLSFQQAIKQHQPIGTSSLTSALTPFHHAAHAPAAISTTTSAMPTLPTVPEAAAKEATLKKRSLVQQRLHFALFIKVLLNQVEETGNLPLAHQLRKRIGTSVRLGVEHSKLLKNHMTMEEVIASCIRPWVGELQWHQARETTRTILISRRVTAAAQQRLAQKERRAMQVLQSFHNMKEAEVASRYRKEAV